MRSIAANRKKKEEGDESTVGFGARKRSSFSLLGGGEKTRGLAGARKKDDSSSRARSYRKRRGGYEAFLAPDGALSGGGKTVDLPLISGPRGGQGESRPRTCPKGETNSSRGVPRKKGRNHTILSSLAKRKEDSRFWVGGRHRWEEKKGKAFSDSPRMGRKRKNPLRGGRQERKEGKEKHAPSVASPPEEKREKGRSDLASSMTNEKEERRPTLSPSESVDKRKKGRALPPPVHRKPTVAKGGEKGIKGRLSVNRLGKRGTVPGLLYGNGGGEERKEGREDGECSPRCSAEASRPQREGKDVCRPLLSSS